MKEEILQDSYNKYKSLDGPERVVVGLIGVLIMLLFSVVIIPLSVLASDSIMISFYTYISVIITLTSTFLILPTIAYVIE